MSVENENNEPDFHRIEINMTSRIIENFIKKISNCKNLKSVNSAISEYVKETQSEKYFQQEQEDNKMENKIFNSEENDYFITQNIKEIELTKLRNKLSINESPIKEIDIDIQEEIENIYENLIKASSGKPENLIKVAMSALDSTERKYFILSNLIEDLKKGQSYSDTIKKYNSVGITNIEVEDSNDEQNNKTSKKGPAILRTIGSLKKLAHALYQIIINSIKSIPSLVKLKPRVGMSGMFPTISFELEGSSVSIQKFFDLLSKQ